MIIILFSGVILIGFGLLKLVCLILTMLVGGASERTPRRYIIVAAALILLASPYAAFKLWMIHATYARLPYPLTAASIDYQREECDCIGLLGDNETGFIVYTLSDESVKWARGDPKRLAASLPGGAEIWHPTPILEDGDYRSQWHRYDEREGRPVHPADISEFLDKYGFGFPITADQEAAPNRSINAPGSVYSYSRGGGVMIIDPAHKKAYFAYAG